MLAFYQLIVDLVFWFLMAVFYCRIAFQWLRAPFVNPVVQGVHQLTRPILAPLERLIPRWRNLSLAAVLVSLLLAWLKLVSIYAWFGIAPGSLALAAPLEWLDFVLGFYFLLCLLIVLFSFVQPRDDNALVPLIVLLMRPILGRIRRWLPPVGMFDFSPLVLILAIYALRWILIAPAMQAIITPR